MALNQLKERANNQCELCASSQNLQVYTVSPKTEESVENSILVCDTCFEQINDESKMNANHWRCLNDSMWNENAAVKVVVWRMLNRLRNEGWPNDLLEMMYIEEADLQWAKSESTANESEEAIVHKDSNGVDLEAGDTVVLIKDLPVKGSSLVAKRGTAVRRITLDRDNPNYIEGRVEGQQIVILTQYVKKV
ncbi:MAG: PhnA domain-containing protein [Crocinitomicaceae bacterium]|nr:PhnA domain-containing protein [Crocinitomicaceae bacterium]